MSQVAIVVDSTHYLQAGFAAEQGWTEVSLYVGIDGVQERELDITDLDDWYARMAASDAMATTSQPSIGDFLAAFEPALAAGRDVVAITLAGGISGTVDSARQAAAAAMEEHPGRRVEVVDSRTGAAAFGIVALAASRCAEGGGDVDAVVARAKAMSEQIHIWFAVDTLEYLRRGGRIGAASALIGTALKIKPILSCRDEIYPVDKVRTSARAVERLVSYAQERKTAGDDAWAVQHIQAPEPAERLMDRMRELFGTEPVATGQVGPVLGAHTGPGLLGLATLPAALLER